MISIKINAFVLVSIKAPSSCGSPDKQINTTIVGTNYNVGSDIEYKCPEGHMLVGDKKRSCGKKGFWSGMAPSCKCNVFPRNI